MDEPNYTEEEVAQMNAEDNVPRKFGDKEYTAYEATQRQRELERVMRKYGEETHLLELGGADEDTVLATKVRYQTASQEYAAFSKAMGLPQQRERIRNGMESLAQYAQTAQKPLDFSGESGIMKSRYIGISGALDPYSKRADKHAEQYYEAVRKMKTDVKHISENTGFSEELIQSIKNYIFIDKHDLGEGRIERFSPNYMMSQSWQRLIDGKNILPHDLTLLKHEQMESELMKQGYSQDEAHLITSKTYNYQKEALLYYGEIEKHRKKK